MSNKDAAKKERELRHLRLFKSLCADFPEGEIVPGREPPDFAVGGTVGIEVTELVIGDGYRKGSALKAAEHGEDMLLSRLRSLCEERRLPPVEVHFHFGFHATSLKDKRLAPALCDIIGSHLPLGHGSVWVGGNDCDSPLPGGIARILIRRPSNNQHAFLPVRAGAEVGLTPELIQEACTEKEKRVAGGYSERWLLIVLEDFAPSSFWSVGSEIHAHRFRTIFDRLFLIKCFDGKCVELTAAKL